MSLEIEICQAIVSTLNATEIAPNCVAQYKTLPRFKLTELVDLKVTVSPRTRNKSNDSRVNIRRDMVVQLSILQKAKPNTDEFDALLDLADELDDRIRQAGPMANCSWISSSSDLYELGSCENDGVFHQIITITYRAITR